MGSGDLDAMLAAVTGGHHPHQCWASRITGVAAEFTTRLEELIAAGEYVNITEAERQLHAVGVRGDISRHFRGDCKCGK